MPKTVVTHFQYPPIPDRSHDWVAYYDGEEEKCQYGYGETETIALTNFYNQELERRHEDDPNALKASQEDLKRLAQEILDETEQGTDFEVSTNQDGDVVIVSRYRT